MNTEAPRTGIFDVDREIAAAVRMSNLSVLMTWLSGVPVVLMVLVTGLAALLQLDWGSVQWPIALGAVAVLTGAFIAAAVVSARLAAGSWDLARRIRDASTWDDAPTWD